MSENVKPLKQFGQNFLKIAAIAEKIVDALELNSDDLVIEIGAGKGILTAIMADKSIKKLVAVEYDRRLTAYLKKEIVPKCKFEIINMDFMNFNFNSMDSSKRMKVIGNIPYHLTSAILYKLIDNYKYVSRAVLMVQEEVADRITANPGIKIYGSLSVVIGLHGSVQKIISVDKTNFSPTPKVDSAVIVIDFFEDIEDIFDYRLLRNLINDSFETRRKMVRNSLRRLYGTRITDQIKTIDLTKRPEQLSVAEFRQLANEIHRLKRATNYHEISTRH
jgi:16S rRNA (adenine1518-N6/adenine1519-N6)-dimethyltransferase